jgi:hypothetical protein
MNATSLFKDGVDGGPPDSFSSTITSAATGTNCDIALGHRTSKLNFSLRLHACINTFFVISPVKYFSWSLVTLWRLY